MNVLMPEDFDPSVPQADRDWICELVQELTGTQPPPLRLLRSMAAKSRLADLGEQSSALAHELRQPLFTIAMVNENLRLMLERPDFDRDRLRRAVERSAEQVRRAQTIIDHTLSYASASGEAQDRCDIAAAAHNGMEFLAELFDTAGVAVRCLTDGPASVRIGAIEMEQVFVNLLRNGVESIQERRRAGWAGKGEVVIALAHHGQRLRCAVSDNGAGLAPDAIQTVFQPFFTTKSHEGTGLGLHICRKILAKADGTIELIPGRDVGATVEMWMTPAE